MGKLPSYDPNVIESAFGLTIKIRAVVCRPLAGYMDSKVTERKYEIGSGTG